VDPYSQLLDVLKHKRPITVLKHNWAITIIMFIYGQALARLTRCQHGIRAWPTPGAHALELRLAWRFP
jgi:hypothetical protein